MQENKRLKRIKMRVNNEGSDVRCQCCNRTRQESLEMFDLMVAGQYFRLCDMCNSELLTHTIRASCAVDKKIKSAHDMEVIRSRPSRFGR